MTVTVLNRQLWINPLVALVWEATRNNNLGYDPQGHN
jgi:hypothetical protein